MNRLTGRNKHHGYITTTSSRHAPGVQDALVERLFVYEETGLTPEQVVEMVQKIRDIESCLDALFESQVDAVDKQPDNRYFRGQLDCTRAIARMVGSLGNLAPDDVRR